MRIGLAAACAGAAFSMATGAAAQAPKVGATVNCNGNVGTIIRTEPRAGWDEPWSIVRVPMGSGTYELKCLAQHMKAVPGAAAPAAAASAGRGERPQRGASPAASAPTGNALCRPGAKLEGLKGISWYEVTVLGPPDANGWCPVRFDGYGAFNDAPVPELRPRGSGPIVKPHRRVPDGPAPRAPAGGAVPDGAYSCSKIEGGGGAYIHIGNATIRGGRVTSLALPTGWRVVSVTRGAPNSWSNIVAEVTYRTASGNTDKLECIPQ